VVARLGSVFPLHQLAQLDMQPANTRVIAAAGAVMTLLAAGSRAGRGHDRVNGEPVDHPETWGVPNFRRDTSPPIDI
jgi:hypothetical protein